MVFVLYEITLMMLMSASLLLMLIHVESLYTQTCLVIYMLYSVLYTHAHLMGMAIFLWTVLILMGVHLLAYTVTIICYILLLTTKARDIVNIIGCLPWVTLSVVL